VGVPKRSPVVAGANADELAHVAADRVDDDLVEETGAGTQIPTHASAWRNGL
jgi:hypothetical protein